MAKKKATKKKATKRRSTGRTRTRRAVTQSGTSKATPALFPTKLTIEWPDGDIEELVFADPTTSSKGNLNAWAGNKFVRNGKMLRVNCNVTQVRG